MVDRQRTCPDCGTPVAEELLICPRCHALLEPPTDADEPLAPPPKPTRPASPPSAPTAPPVNPFAVELGRRLARIGQWAESAEALGVELPRLPPWAEEIARSAPNPEPWAEVVRGIERLAQRRIVTAFEEWDRRAKGRLARLEAYAVDSRLEREQIDDALHAARVGDVAHALSTFQQVDRVVALKERHLDQAREDLERIVSLLRDLQALGLPVPQDPAIVGRNLEAELRAGRIAPLRQQIRALRLQAIDRLKSSLPKFVSEYGDFLLQERTRGIATEREATELAQGARDVFQGRPEEGIRRLHTLQQTHGSPTSRRGAAGPGR